MVKAVFVYQTWPNNEKRINAVCLNQGITKDAWEAKGKAVLVHDRVDHYYNKSLIWGRTGTLFWKYLIPDQQRNFYYIGDSPYCEYFEKQKII